MLEPTGAFFRDGFGRAVMLRGVNLSGAAKTPAVPLLYTHVRQDFFESARTVSFVDRPFPVAQADEHFARLKLWVSKGKLIRLGIQFYPVKHYLGSN